MTLDFVSTAEAPELAKVHATAFPHPWDAEAFAELLGSPGVFALLARAERPVGLILCRIAAAEVEVLTVGVDPAARRAGLGRALVSAGLAAARQAGADEAFLEVAVDNPAAIALYESLGFSRAGVRRAYYDRGADGRVDAIVMRLDLPSLSA